jgi:methyl-accepting chemotaxis protein
LAEIVTAVKKVADVIAEISAASIEQATGIEQVNTAIIQMDQGIQQNAALVEEVSATSESMTHVAQDLQSLVGKFTIDPKYVLLVQRVEASFGSLAATGTDDFVVDLAVRGRKERNKPKLTILNHDDSNEEF